MEGINIMDEGECSTAVLSAFLLRSNEFSNHLLLNKSIKTELDSTHLIANWAPQQTKPAAFTQYVSRMLLLPTDRVYDLLVLRLNEYGLVPPCAYVRATKTSASSLRPWVCGSARGFWDEGHLGRRTGRCQTLVEV